MAKLIRMEIWDEVECNSGTRQEFVPLDEVPQIIEHLELGGDEHIEFSVNPLGTWSFNHGYVIRLVYDDGDWDEYRIVSEQKERSQSGAMSRTLVARSIKYDLMTFQLCEWEQVNGLVLMHHELVDITPDEMIDALVDAAVFPSYFAKGTVENTTDKYTISWDWETPLSAIEEVATISGLELEVERNGTTNYLIHLRTEIGSSAEKPQIRFAKNILNASVEFDSETMGTKIYPKGEGPQGAAASIGDMRFRAVQLFTPPTATWGLHAYNGAADFTSNAEGQLINETNQFTGFYIEDMDNNLYEITGCSSALSGRRIVVTLDTAISIDDQVVHMREAAAVDGEGGKELTYIPLPSAQALYGDHAMILERLDIPGVTNLMLDPFLEDWQAAAQHYLVGTPTVTTVAAPNERVHYGNKVVKVEADTAEGIQVNIGKANVTVEEIVQPGRPHLSFQVWLYLEQGQVEFYVDFNGAFDVSSGTPVPFERWPAAESFDSDGKDVSSAKTDLIVPSPDKDKGNFFHLTLEPQLLDFDKDIRPHFPQGTPIDWEGDDIRLMLLATTDTTIFYVDAVQVVNETTVGDKFVAGSSHSKLWDAAIRAFDDGVAEPKKTVNFDALDLERLDSATYPYDEIYPGVTARINDPTLDALFDGTFERRVFSVERDLKHEALTQIELLDEDVS